MNIAVIIAGGSGHRMGQDIPKQFINVYDKPVLIYTLEGFQEHPQIDAIEVVCIDGWHDVLRAYAKQFNITKLKWIVSGGDSGQESIRNGVYNLEGKASADDIIVIHDGIRPLVDASVLTDVLLKAKNMAMLLPLCHIMNRFLLLIRKTKQRQKNTYPERRCGAYLRLRHTDLTCWINGIMKRLNEELEFMDLPIQIL